MAEQDLGAFQFPTHETRPDFRSAIDPLSGRYSEREIEQHFSEETRVAYQAYVEAALAHTYADFGKCSRDVALEIEAASATIGAEEVEDREKGRGEFQGRGTGHDVVALTDAITDRVSDEAKPWVHAAATSYDIISTASALQFKEGVRGLVLPRVILLGDAIADLTYKYAHVVQVGRTHGQHGVPITFGFATSRYLGRLGEALEAVDARAGELQGKFSGAVGGYNASSLINEDPKAFEATFLARLGLTPCEHATQIVPAENMLRLLSELAVVSGIMAQIGDDMRNLQRTEIGEIGEKFDEQSQRGSSTMPQKRNPINFENAAGMHREVLGQLFNAYQNLVSDHQRDLRDSASMRFYSTIPAMVARTALNLAKTLNKIEVNEPNLQRNLRLTEGAIASEALQVILRDRGNVRAYAIAKRIVETAQKNDQPFREVVVSDEETAEVLKNIPTYQREAIVHPEENYIGLSLEESMRHLAAWDNIKSEFEEAYQATELVI
jgi:adenylosuccinate lyase